MNAAPVLCHVRAQNADQATGLNNIKKPGPPHPEASSSTSSNPIHPLHPSSPRGAPVLYTRRSLPSSPRRGTVHPLLGSPAGSMVRRVRASPSVGQTGPASKVPRRRPSGSAGSASLGSLQAGSAAAAPAAADGPPAVCLDAALAYALATFLESRGHEAVAPTAASSAAAAMARVHY